MTPFETSMLAWIGGGTLGALVAKEHRVMGFVFGALVVGAVADKFIERNHPQYSDRIDLPGPGW